MTSEITQRNEQAAGAANSQGATASDRQDERTSGSVFDEGADRGGLLKGARAKTYSGIHNVIAMKICKKRTVVADVPIAKIRRVRGGAGYGSVETAKLADDLRRRGLIEPLTVYRAGKSEYGVISGGRRLEALIMLGAERAQCVILPCAEKDAKRTRFLHVCEHARSEYDLAEELLMIKTIKREAQGGERGGEDNIAGCANSGANIADGGTESINAESSANERSLNGDGSPSYHGQDTGSKSAREAREDLGEAITTDSPLPSFLSDSDRDGTQTTANRAFSTVRTHQLSSTFDEFPNEDEKNNAYSREGSCGATSGASYTVPRVSSFRPGSGETVSGGAGNEQTYIDPGVHGRSTSDVAHKNGDHTIDSSGKKASIIGIEHTGTISGDAGNGGKDGNGGIGGKGGDEGIGGRDDNRNNGADAGTSGIGGNSGNGGIDVNCGNCSSGGTAGTGGNIGKGGTTHQDCKSNDREDVVSEKRAAKITLNQEFAYDEILSDYLPYLEINGKAIPGSLDGVTLPSARDLRKIRAMSDQSSAMRLLSISDEAYRSYCVDLAYEVYAAFEEYSDNLIRERDRRFRRYDKAVLKNVNVIFGSIDSILSRFKDSGLDCVSTRSESDGEFEYVLRVKKHDQH